MSEQEKQKNKKPAKYNDAETRKSGLPIETPYKYGDLRNKRSRDAVDNTGITNNNE